MKTEEKTEYVCSFLQMRIDEEFPFPFQVTYEDEYFLFRLKNSRKECSAKLRRTDEVIAGIVHGTKEQKEEEVRRIFEILSAALAARENTAFADCSDYEKVRNELILRPLNYQRVKKDIQDVPYIRVGDIALVLYAVMAHSGNDYFTAKIHRNQMQNWKGSEEEILEEALINTSFLYPPRLYSVEQLLAWEVKQKEDGRFMAQDPFSINRGMRSHVLTNTLEINGAIAIFYPGVARKIAEGFGEDFYIAFTSIHEVQVHSASMITPDIIKSSIREMNHSCNRADEVLTNAVYCYSAESRSFGQLIDGRFLEVRKDV